MEERVAEYAKTTADLLEKADQLAENDERMGRAERNKNRPEANQIWS